MARELIDLAGRTFGRWAVLAHATDVDTAGGKSHRWLCRCACGTEKAVRGSELRRGRSTSCGCTLGETLQVRAHARRRVLFKREYRWVVGRYYLGSIRCRARYSGAKFKLSRQYINDLLLGQEMRCALSGLPIGFCPASECGPVASKGTTASLTRKDVSLGYVPGNVQWVHKDVSRMKQHIGPDRLMELCRLIAAKADRERAAHRAGALATG